MNDYYFELNHDDFYDDLIIFLESSYAKYLFFNKTELNNIKDFLNKIDKNAIIEFDSEEGYKMELKYFRDDISAFIDFYKLPDEWYYIKFITLNGIRYYKCDQWEGLIKFLKNHLC